MNIAIIGIGGVGGYFGGKIAKCFEFSDLHNVYFIARGEHLNQIKTNGLILKTQNEGTIISRPFLATDNFIDLPLLDVVLICVKSYDLDNVLQNLKPHIKDDTEIMPLLNGIDIVQQIRGVVKNGVVLPSCVYIGTHIECAGTVAQSGGTCIVKTGYEQNATKPENLRILDVFTQASINFEFSGRNYIEIWTKYMFIAAYGLITAFYDKTIGQVYENRDLSNKVIDIMRLIDELAHREGIALECNVVETSYRKAENFPYETKTSFQRDYERSKPDERNIFGLSLINLAKKHNLDCECVETIYNQLNTQINN